MASQSHSIKSKLSARRAVFWLAFICNAILMRQLLGYRLASNRIKIVEPHAYGIMHDGHHALWSWRLSGKGSDPSAVAAWELVG